MDFEEIYEAYFGAVYRYISRLSNNAQIAEEIASETFFRAMRAIDGFRGECDIRVWLCQIAKHCYYDYLKKSRRADGVDVRNSSAMAGEIEDRLIRSEEADQIRKLLHELPEPQREVFMWRVYAELSFKQIGQMFGRTENWACVTYHRAKGAIKRRLEELNHEE